MVAHHTKEGQHMGEEHQIEERLEKEHHMEEDHYRSVWLISLGNLAV